MKSNPPSADYGRGSFARELCFEWCADIIEHTGEIEPLNLGLIGCRRRICVWEGVEAGNMMIRFRVILWGRSWLVGGGVGKTTSRIMICNIVQVINIEVIRTGVQKVVIVNVRICGSKLAGASPATS